MKEIQNFSRERLHELGVDTDRILGEHWQLDQLSFEIDRDTDPVSVGFRVVLRGPQEGSTEQTEYKSVQLINALQQPLVDMAAQNGENLDVFKGRINEFTIINGRSLSLPKDW